MSGEAVIVLITMVAFIALYVGIGVYMIVIGRPKLLYGYLCGNADDRDLPKLARLCGYGVLLETLGIAFFFVNRGATTMPWIPVWMGSGGILVVAGIVFAGYLGVQLGAIIHYNGSLIP